ncbi:MAG: Flp family type IVb pilin [Alphaproteobacteria bacterium]
MLPMITKAQCTWYRAKSRVQAYLKDSEGATAIEYGLIAAGIAVAIIAAVFALGDTISNFFNSIGDNLSNAS